MLSPSQEYWDTVSLLARIAIDEHSAEGAELEDIVHELVDGSSWVIYRHQNFVVLQESPNFWAIDDEGLGPFPSFLDALAHAAYLAMAKDVFEAIEQEEGSNG
jgi:hypothetical protein